MELVSGFPMREGPVSTDFSVCGNFEDEMAVAGGFKLDTGICGPSVLTPSPREDFSFCEDFEGELAPRPLFTLGFSGCILSFTLSVDGKGLLVAELLTVPLG